MLYGVRVLLYRRLPRNPLGREQDSYVRDRLRFRLHPRSPATVSAPMETAAGTARPQGLA